MSRRRREDRGVDDSVEIDLLLNYVEDVKVILTRIEDRLDKIEKMLEMMKGA